MVESIKSIQRTKSNSLFEQAQHVIPGGVNSPVRAFKSVGGNPVFFKKAKGAWMWDEDDNAYVDLINSWGPMILGHCQPDILKATVAALNFSSSFGAPTEMEVKMADKIVSLIPSIEKVRMVNSGTEATMSAVRLARGYTKRDKIIKFEGCYHGHGDSFLIAAGSGAMTFGVPDSPGVTAGVAKDTLTARFNDLASVRKLSNSNKDQIAAIILEPVAGNMGVIPPDSGFLEGLRTLCDEEGIVLIFDEVMTGFRVKIGGAQELYGVDADITTLGKIIGGGLPVGAYGGKKEIMDFISPQGPVYQAGTLSGNPVAMNAGYAMLSQLHAHPEYYDQLEKSTATIAQGLGEIATRKGIPHYISQVGSMATLFFNENPIKNFEDAKNSDTKRFGKFFRAMLDRGVYLPPSQFESFFVSTSIGQKEIDHILSAAEESIQQL